LDSILGERLGALKKNHRYRYRKTLSSSSGRKVKVGNRELLCFCSNDYLGLATDPGIAEAMMAATERYGSGSGASHLICGHSVEHQQLEWELAAFTGRERALVFSSGYMANLGVINALVGRTDTIFEDRLNHASLIDGARLSGATLKRFRHNDLDELSRRLETCSSPHKLIAVDGVFSMDGDFAKLPELAKVARDNDAWLMVDDAHGIGCIGDKGGGSLQHFGLGQEQVPILVGTLGKAFGTSGAFVAGSEALIESLVQYARTYIYTTAMPPAIAAATRASLKLIAEDRSKRIYLNELISLFREGAGSLGLPILDSFTAIQPLLVGDDQRAVQISDKLLELGYWVGAIRPPTVPSGTSRLRITLSAAHKKEDVQGLLAVLDEISGMWEK